jgi:hypothetical protein
LSDPKWYTDLVADPASAEWVRFVEACVGWLGGDVDDPEAAITMGTSGVAYALAFARAHPDGTGTMQVQYAGLVDAVMMVVGLRGVDAPSSMVEARALRMRDALEIERLRARVAELEARLGVVTRG